MGNDKEVFEKIYGNPEAGWTKHNPPPELSDLIQKEQIKRCKAIDIGCGEGFYSIYLASMGFEVVGVDLSERAIGYARENAIKAHQDIRFISGDLISLVEIKETFYFALEWSVLHHVMPPQRRNYIENIWKLLNKGGKYLVTCFSEKNIKVITKEDKYKTSPVGTKLYYSSQVELIDLYEPYFQIIENKLISFEAPRGVSNIYNYFFMEKY